MGGTGLVWRAWLRHRGVAAVTLVVLLGVGVGVGLAAIAGARRTASSYGRVLEAAAAPDIVSGHGLPAEEAVRRAREVRGARSNGTDVGFTGYVEGFDPVLVPYYIGAYDHPISNDLQLLTDGRYPHPDRADEILISARAAETAGFEVGDEIAISFFTTDGEQQSERFTIAGIGRERRDAVGDASLARDVVRLTPAFTRDHLELQVWARTTFVASDLSTLRTDLLARGYPIDETKQIDHQRAQDSVRPIVLSLAGIGVVALLATALVVHQALAREVQGRRRDRQTLTALGVTRRAMRSADLLVLAVVLIPGLLLAAVLAVALSGLAPVGRVRTLEPDRGITVDWTILAAGTTAMAVVLAASYLMASRRDRTSRTSQITTLAPVPRAGLIPATGLQLALGSVREARRTFWTTIIVTTSAIALVIGSVTFIGALDLLTNEPVRYGFGWDLATRNAYGEVDPAALIDQFGDDPDIAAVAAGTSRTVIINGEHSVPGMSLLPVTGTFWPTVAEGRVPQGQDEVLMGGATMEALAIELGDEIVVSAGDAGSGAPTQSVDVVGRAVFAPIELAGLDPPRLDVGVALDFDLYQRLSDPVLADGFEDKFPDIVYFDLVDGVDPQTIVDRYPEGVPDSVGIPTEWLLSVAPAEVIESNRALPLLWGALIPMALVVLATVAHAQLTLVRRRRPDYAVLKSLGFTRTQILATVAWQAAPTVVLPLVIGVPLGIALGRTGFTAFARLIGVIDDAVVPVAAIGLTAVTAMILVNAVSLLPASIASRVNAASVLRGE